MKNIGELRNLLSRMMMIPALKRHAESLMGPRMRGSLTDKGLSVLSDDVQLVEFTPADDVRDPKCRYFGFHSPELYGRLGAIALEVALSRGWTVKSREGAHGLELFRDVTPEDCTMPRVDDFVVILGPDTSSPDELVAFTWHPGEPLRSFKGELTARTAVKVHNG